MGGQYCGPAWSTYRAAGLGGSLDSMSSLHPGWLQMLDTGTSRVDTNRIRTGYEQDTNRIRKDDSRVSGFACEWSCVQQQPWSIYTLIDFLFIINLILFEDAESMTSDLWLYARGICDRQGQELINREEEFETNFDMGYGISGRISVVQSDPSHHPKWSFGRPGQVSGGVSLYFMAFVEALCLVMKTLMFQG